MEKRCAEGEGRRSGELVCAVRCPMNPMNPLWTLYLVCLALAAAVPAWWLGTSTPSAQITFAVLSAVALGCGVKARAETVDGDNAAKRSMGRKLGRIATAAALLFLGWITVQMLNPSHAALPGWGPGVLAEQAHVSWLPSGIAAPFARTAGDVMPYENGARQLLVFAGVGLFAAAVVHFAWPALSVGYVLLA